MLFPSFNPIPSKPSHAPLARRRTKPRRRIYGRTPRDRAARGNGLTTQRRTDPRGRTSALTAGSNTSTLIASVYNTAYQYDSEGNLTGRSWRDDGAVGASPVPTPQTRGESYGYDALNRLTQIVGNNGPVNKTFTYQANGNLATKDGLTYLYGNAAKPHQLTGITGSVSGVSNPRYSYDANGNLISVTAASATPGQTAAGVMVSWTSFDMPLQMSGGNGTAAQLSNGTPTPTANPAAPLSSFSYGPEHQRVQQIATGLLNPSAPTQRHSITTLYVPGYERETNSQTRVVEHKHYLTVGNTLLGVIIDRSASTHVPTAANPATPASLRTKYFHLDHLGSIAVVTNETGQVIERYNYDAWGKRRNLNGTDLVLIPNPNSAANATDRGYTGHEQLDHLGFIHMNGRIYDPTLGRFLSADPFIQEPGNLQNHNRYAYVMNNPLSATDPNGYFFKWIARKWREEIWRSPVGRSVLGIAVGLATQQWYLANFTWGGTIAAGAAGGFSGGLVASGGDIRAGFQGALTGGMFGYIGTQFPTAPGAFPAWEAVAAHAATGCVSASLQGGNCGSGAISAGLGKIAAPYIESFAGSQTMGDRAAGAMLAATVGGTVSQLTGNKFANGAVTGAFGYLFNQVQASFNRRSGALRVRDIQTGKEASGQFFSGTGSDDQIAAGRYAILDRGGKDGFRLEAIDSMFGDDMNVSGQSLLRLHGPGRSVGCITACDGSNWGTVKNFIQSTTTSTATVNTYQTFAPGGHMLFRRNTGTETLKYYGTLDVK